MELTKHILYLALYTASLANPSRANSVPGLFEALNKAGASQFAVQLQNDASILDLFVSGDIGTVFAPQDADDLPRYMTRQQANATGQQDLEYQLFKRLHEWREITDDQDLTSVDNSTNLNGKNQSVVIKPTSNNTTSRPTPKFRRYGEPEPPFSFAQISTGLGDISNIIQKDIEFSRCGSNGIIHIIDKYFTVPVNLSETAAALPELSTFASLIGCPCLKQELDWKPSITVFIPSNEAFASAGVTGKSTSDTASRVKGLVVPDFVGYSPDLVNGMRLTTLNGSRLTVGVDEDGGNLWVGGARVIKSDVILFNGVAHIIDKVGSFLPYLRVIVRR